MSGILVVVVVFILVVLVVLLFGGDVELFRDEVAVVLVIDVVVLFRVGAIVVLVIAGVLVVMFSSAEAKGLKIETPVASKKRTVITSTLRSKVYTLFSVKAWWKLICMYKSRVPVWLERWVEDPNLSFSTHPLNRGGLVGGW